MASEPAKKIRVLLIAEACNPEWVSIPLEGWSHSQAIGELADAHLVTQVRNRDAILRAGKIEGRDFTAIDSEAIAAPIYKLAGLLRGGSGKGWTTVTALSALTYPYFENRVWKKFGRRIQAGEFDVVHRLTPLSPTMPSPLARLCHDAGVPFVIGPLNGGVPWPKYFDAARRQEKEWLSYLRKIYRLLPGYWQTRRNASAILIGSSDTWEQMPPVYRDKYFYVPENAVDPARFTKPRQRIAELPIHVIFVGRLVPYKGADMLLEAAIPLAKKGDVTIQIIGDGPQMPRLKEMIRKAEVGAAVELSGSVPHTQLQDHLSKADVFAFPSVREFGGAAVLEAMAMGVVPIVVAYGGPAELVTPSTGIFVPLSSRERIVDDFRRHLSDLCNDPEKIEAKSTLARRRALEQFTWQAKAMRVLEIYRWLRRRGPKPAWPMPTPDHF